MNDSLTAPPRPRIHLVTYATPRFRVRQRILGLSAKFNHVADTVTEWNPKRLLAAGFEASCPGISVHERGGGFWAWKPFIISQAVEKATNGDVVFYCDVGRTYPFKLLTCSIEPWLRWMDSVAQDVMPGVEIPWDGPMETWTKRDALFHTGMDVPEVLQASPIQASFSIWRASPKSRAFARKWTTLCSRRDLISDAPSVCGLPEHKHFFEHRHDQSLLSLCCFSENIKGLDLGKVKPNIDLRHPCKVATFAFATNFPQESILGKILRIATGPLEIGEKITRSRINFGSRRATAKS